MILDSMNTEEVAYMLYRKKYGELSIKQQFNCDQYKDIHDSIIADEKNGVHNFLLTSNRLIMLNRIEDYARKDRLISLEKEVDDKKENEGIKMILRELKKIRKEISMLNDKVNSMTQK